MKNTPILVFDSWIWSYSVIQEMLKVLPDENIIYLADRNSYPYWEKNKSELMENTLWVIRFFEKNYHPKIIVLASNTPSIQILEDLKNIVETPLFGVFPPLRDACKSSKTREVAILATKSAVESNEINDFINTETSSSDIRVHKINASPMVSLIEPWRFISNKNLSEEVCKETIKPYLDNAEIDVMTFSSTHLPFLREYLERLYPDVCFLNPADKVSEEIRDFLKLHNLESDSKWSLKVLWTENKKKNLYNKDLQEIFQKMWFICNIETIEIE